MVRPIRTARDKHNPGVNGSAWVKIFTWTSILQFQGMEGLVLSTQGVLARPDRAVGDINDATTIKIH